MSANVGEALLVEAVVPCLVSLILCLVLLVLLKLFLSPFSISQKRHKNAAVISLFFVAFYGYGPAVDTLRNVLDFRELLSPAQVLLSLGVALVVALASVRFFLRTNRSIAWITPFLNVISAIAIIIVVFSITTTMLRQKDYALKQSPSVVDAHASGGTRRPDIYYIVLDMYTRQDLLQSYFKHDNTEFLGELQEKGFYVANMSRSNYMRTLFSIPSSLNYSYIDDMAMEKAFGGMPPLAKSVSESKAVGFLRERGYEIVALASGSSTTEMRNADRYLKPTFVLTEFHSVLIDLTPIRSVLNRMEIKWEYYLHRKRLLFSLDTLASMESTEQPKFVFAHIMAPHWPFVFDEDGSGIYKRGNFEEGYRRQLVYLNERLIEIAGAIQKRDPNSVIIFQGDHGPRRASPALKDKNWEAFIKDQTAILNAVYIPGLEYDEVLYPSITPVNTFRVIFNQYFDAGLPLLKDETKLFGPAYQDGMVVTEKAF